MIDQIVHRQALQGRHPIARRNGYTLETTMIRLVKNLLFTWIELRKSGLAFAGASRAGKTTAMKAIVEALRRSFPDLVILYLSSETQSPTERYERMFTQFLQQLHKATSLRRRTEDCDAMSNYLMALCRDAGAHFCIIMMDEAQKLSIHQWEGIGILWNRLEMNDFGMCVFPFGSEELRYSAKLIQSGAGSQGVAGRIFVKVMDFDGVRTRDELEAILKQYDEKLFYPDPTWPFTRYFAQSAYESGWRLSRETEAFWEALSNHAVDFRASGRGYGMEWITDPIHMVLKDCLNDEKYIPGMTALRWREALDLLCPTKIC